jgi:hypothetical protein
MAESSTAAKPARAPRPKPVTIYRHNPDDYDGSHVAVKKFDHPDPKIAEHQARAYIKANHPRGRDVFLQLPDGSREHYSADLAAQDGEENGWLEYSEDEDE